MNKLIVKMGAFLFMCVMVIPLFAQERKIFEGELHYKAFENIDRNAEKYSLGLSYNGSRRITILVKGNKTLYKDESIHMNALLDPDNNFITFYSDVIKQGIRFDYGRYVNTYLSVFASKGTSIYLKGNIIQMPPLIYRFETEKENFDFLGYNTDYIKGRIEYQASGVSLEIYRTSKYLMPRSTYAIQLYGIELDGLITKFTYQTDADLGLDGKRKLKGFSCMELQEAVERDVDDSEIIVPHDIVVENSTSVFKICKLCKRNEKQLKKLNMYPNQEVQDVTYKIDDENWDF